MNDSTLPVLFIVFNRADTALKVLAAIAVERPPRLYIAADGPRPGRLEEASRTHEVRTAVLDAIDWPCDVKTLFHDHNLGCRRGVITAINWFFKHELEGVILEDDVIPSPDFFRYCGEMLDRYRDDPRVMMVSGTNQLGQEVVSSQYFFSSLGSIWGWASWRDAWARYDEKMTGWGKSLATELDQRHGRATGRYLRHIFDFHQRNDVDTWDTQWMYTIQATKGLTVMPEANLVRNIGIIGTHSSVETSNHNLAYGTISWPLVARSCSIEDDEGFRRELTRRILAPALSLGRISRLARSVRIDRPLRWAYKALFAARSGR